MKLSQIFIIIIVSFGLVGHVVADSETTSCISSIDSSLNIYIPSAEVQITGETHSFWLELEYKGANSDGEYIWKLINAGTSSICTDSNLASVGSDFNINIQSADLNLTEDVSNIWIELAYKGIDADGYNVWKLVNAGFNSDDTVAGNNEVYSASNNSDSVNNEETCTDFSGNWTLTLTVKCDNNMQYTMHDSGPMTQNNCQTKFVGAEGDTITGTASGDTMFFSAVYNYKGMDVKADGSLEFEKPSGQLRGSAETNLSIPGCSSFATIQGFPK
ncbi:MAG: hypothetical protein KZQ83_18730 [gamma proteobacterium symbiont of Taylorina sp.]|nr:hypothetical protein [gamma proteobacterium symbiont of Taylorina sp.]